MGHLPPRLRGKALNHLEEQGKIVLPSTPEIVGEISKAAAQRCFSPTGTSVVATVYITSRPLRQRIQAGGSVTKPIAIQLPH